MFSLLTTESGTKDAFLLGNQSILSQVIKDKMKRTDKTLSPQLIAGCLDVLCKAHAQIAPADANLAEEIREAIETIMEAWNSIEKVEENVGMSKKNKADQFQQAHTEIIEDLFTGEILYRGIK